MKRVYILLECTLEKEGQIPADLVALVESRAYTINGIENTSGRLLDGKASFPLARAVMEDEKCN